MTTAARQTVRLHPADNVVVACADLPSGTSLQIERITTMRAIPAGHKLATAPIAQGEPVRKYNQIIGFAAQDIAVGQHVHLHNVELHSFDRSHQIGVDVRPTDMVPQATRATFEGIVRPDGRVATRNYIGLLTTVNCSASVAEFVADQFRGDALADFPNVDGVVALTHDHGCGGCTPVSKSYIQRTVAGYARHPNFAAVVIIGLGCEQNQISELVASGLVTPDDRIQTFTIQESGGTAESVRRGTGLVHELLEDANNCYRQRCPASELILGLECGGSDGYSGISANPALGVAADLLVRHGGTACLAETPEIFGAEHLLTRRAVHADVGEKLLERIRWWQQYAAASGADLDHNPSPGNTAGGITTILEKSLGAQAKGGSTNLVAVYNYAESIDQHGLVFMDTPGYDPPSVTGMVAGGANIVCFTTGRGSVFGCKPVPSLKLATNTPMYRSMQGDMDINCGTIIDGYATIDELGQHIFERMLSCASGERTKSETLGFGDNEFVPWTVGAIL